MQYNSPLTAQYGSIGFVMGVIGLVFLAAQFAALRRGGGRAGRTRARGAQPARSGGQCRSAHRPRAAGLGAVAEPETNV